MTPAAPASDGAAASPPDAAADRDEVAPAAGGPDDVASADTASTDPDDADALSWGDTDDATHVDAAHNTVRTRSTRERDADGPVGSGALIGFGVLGGLYLLYTVAWLVGASAMSGTAGLAAEGMRVLAIMAPALWYVTTLWVGQRSANRTKFIWLVVGALVLIPWPFILTRSFG